MVRKVKDSDCFRWKLHQIKLDIRQLLLPVNLDFLCLYYNELNSSGKLSCPVLVSFALQQLCSGYDCLCVLEDVHVCMGTCLQVIILNSQNL